MFLVNSCLGLFTAGYRSNLPFSRSYGVILPSSLAIVLSLTLEYSSCPPVAVLGTGTYVTDGMTEKANKSQLLDSGLSTKASMLGNPYYYTAEV